MKKLLSAVAVAGLALFTTQAKEIDINGSFEKTYKAKSGVDFPVQWSDNSKGLKDKIQVIDAKDAPAGKKVMKLTALSHILTVLKKENCPKLTAKSIVTITAKVKGSGILEPQIVFIDANGKRMGRFDCRNNKVNSLEKWTDLDIEIDMAMVEKRFKKGKPASFNYVVLCCRKGTVYVDGLKVGLDEE